MERAGDFLPDGFAQLAPVLHRCGVIQLSGKPNENHCNDYAEKSSFSFMLRTYLYIFLTLTATRKDLKLKGKFVKM